MKDKEIKLVAFAVEGTLSKLMEIETLMILLGYRSDEVWNKNWIDSKYLKHDEIYRLYFFKSVSYIYCIGGCVFDMKLFKSSNVSGILKYIEAYQHKTNK